MLLTPGRTVRSLPNQYAGAFFAGAFLNRNTMTWHDAGGLYEGALLNEAIRRYTLVWMPFLNSVHQPVGSKVTLVPPLDVAYVWHVHRLDRNYESHCKQLFGQVFIPAQPFAFTTDAPAGWDRFSQDPSSPWVRPEPFYPPKLDRAATAAWHEIKERYLLNLAEAVKRQAPFGHMFLRLCYQDRSYLELVSQIA